MIYGDSRIRRETHILCLRTWIEFTDYVFELLPSSQGVSYAVCLLAQRFQDKDASPCCGSGVGFCKLPQFFGWTAFTWSGIYGCVASPRIYHNCCTAFSSWKIVDEVWYARSEIARDCLFMLMPWVHGPRLHLLTQIFVHYMHCHRQHVHSLL